MRRLAVDAGTVGARAVGAVAVIGLLVAMSACGGAATDEPAGSAADAPAESADGAAAVKAEAQALEPPQFPPGEPCPDRPVENYLETDWQLCWFEEDGGRWRRLDHTLHYSVLVVQAEATSLDLAETIARRFVEQQSERFPDEIMVYVHAAPVNTPTRVRRVTWTPGGGYQVLDFDA